MNENHSDKNSSLPVFVALGGNLPSQVGDAAATLRAALVALKNGGVTIEKCSRFYRSAPVPPSGQPDYINAVARVCSHLSPPDLLNLLHSVELEFGRARSVRNAARPLDLDLLVYGNCICSDDLVLPHPRMLERAFVLLPLAEVVTEGWLHPVTQENMTALLAALPPGQACHPLEDGGSA